MANTHNVAKSVPSPKKHEIRLNPAEFEKSIERSCKAVLLGPSNDCDELDTVVFCEMFSRRKSPEFVITDVQKFENKSVASVKPVTEPKKRWIVCAAVKTTDGVVHTGKRHSDCFTLIGALG